MMKSWMLAFTLGVLSVVGFGATTDLFYYCTFDSNADVQSPVAGNAGTCSGATYQTGKFGKALYVPVGSGVVKVPFHAGIPTEKGCIEFWAKIKNPSTSYIDGGDPRFFNISTEGELSANSVVTLMFNSNNGAGQSGICGNLGNVFWTTHSSWRMSTPYSQEFNGGDPFDWHHYAIVWNVDGINGTTDAVRVYQDESVIWRCAVSQIDKASFIQALRASLDLWFALPFNTTNPTHNKSPYLIDEFKIWGTDRTTFGKLDYDMSGVKWSDERTFVYDGQEHVIALSGLPEGVTATISGNVAKDAGEYVATATFSYDSSNYNMPKVDPCAWTIRRRDLVLRVADKDKGYDGFALSASAADVTGEGYVEGESLDYFDFSSLSDMGEGASTFSFRDSDSAKAGNYNVRIVEGRLRVSIGGSVFSGRVISTKMRESDPTVMDVTYVVNSLKDKVDVRMVVFKDGVRSFANVVLPEKFIDGTEANVGDGVAANVTNVVSWSVAEDWSVDLAKVKVEILVKPSATYLPFNWVTIPGRGGTPTVRASTNGVEPAHLFNALLWAYADRDRSLELVDGVLKSGGETLVNGATFPSDAATRYVFGLMGYDLLADDLLEYVRSALRKPLTVRSACDGFAVKTLGE